MLLLDPHLHLNCAFILRFSSEAPVFSDCDSVVFYRSELADYEEQQEQRQIMLAEEQDRKRLEEWAKKHHHLISTTVQPGIYNSPFQP